MKYWHSSFFLLSGSCLASATSPIINPPLPSLSDQVLQQHLELLLVDHRFDSSWNEPEFLAYALGTILSEHVELNLFFSKEPLEKVTAVVNVTKLLQALRSFERSTREKLLKHTNVDRFAYEKHIAVLGEFISEYIHFDSEEQSGELIEISFERLLASIFDSQRPYASITISVALLRALADTGEVPDMELLECMDAPLRVILGLLHIPRLAPLVRPHVYKLVSTIFRFQDVRNGLLLEKRNLLYSLARTLPQSDPILQQLIFENITDLVGTAHVKGDLYLFEPLLSDSLKSKLSRFAIRQGINKITEPKTISQAFFYPIIVTSGLVKIHRLEGFTITEGYLTRTTRINGKAATPFIKSIQAPMFKLRVVTAVTPQQLLARQEVVILYHEQPLDDDFKERVRFWINGDENVATPMFIYTLYAAGVTIFSSKAIQNEND